MLCSIPRLEAQVVDGDGDGIADSTDGCPYIAGPAQYNGCPGMPLDVPWAGGHIYFAPASAALNAAGRASLDELRRTAHADTALFIYLYGHTDNIGSIAANRRLSQRRADECRKYLVAHGIAPYRVMAYGYGEEAPLENNNTPSDRRKNRCVVPGLKKFKK